MQVRMTIIRCDNLEKVTICFPTSPRPMLCAAKKADFIENLASLLAYTANTERVPVIEYVTEEDMHNIILRYANPRLSILSTLLTYINRALYQS